MKNIKCIQLCLFIFLFAFSANSQKIIKGLVLDASDKLPLIGANVAVPETNIGTTTDFDGKFSIELTEGIDAIEISYIGYQTVVINEIDVEGDIVVELSQGSLLDEVVVVGYSSQKRSDVTGSIALVNVDEIARSPYSNVVQSMQGKVSGVTITQDGQPGGGRTNLKIRGVTTVNNNNPLYVVDGIPTTSDLNNISATDIESIQVLKDASASIYGSRAASGVVIITTKKGKKGKIAVEAGTLSGMQTIANKIDLLNATEWGEVYWAAAQNAGLDTKHPAYGNGDVSALNVNPFIIPNGKQIYQYTETGTNWYDEIYQNAFQQQHYLNVTNGGERGNYFLGVNYFDQDGLIKETHYNRINTRLNSSYKLLKGIQIGENLSVSFSDEVQVGTQRGQDGIPTDVLRQHPALPVLDLEGGYAGKISGFPDVRNMVSVLEKNKDNNSRSLRILGNVFGEIDLFELIGILDNQSLKLKTNYGIEHSQYYARNFQASFQEGDFDIQNNFLNYTYGFGLTNTWTNTLNYSFTLGKSELSSILGYETIDYDYEFLSGENTGFLIEDPAFTFLNAGSGEPRAFGSGTSYALRSYFGRLNYAFDDKYLFTAIMRRDETSRFRDLGYFPSFSVGWKMSNENFFNNLPFSSKVDELKIKGSWGQLGNQTAGDFTQLSLIGSNINIGNYDITGSNTGAEQGFVVISLGNPNVKWETTTQTNAGIFLSMLNGTFEFEFDYWIKKTNDILFRPPLLAVQGEGEPPVVNIGSMTNNGFDLMLNYNTKPFANADLGLSFQIGHYRNVFDQFGFDVSTGNEDEAYLETGDGITRIVEGQPYGVYYGYQVEGIFQNQAEVDAHAEQLGKDIGRLKYQDINQDGVVNDEDRVYLGSYHPDLTTSLGLNFSWKNIDFSTSLYASIGGEVYNRNRIYTHLAQAELFNHSTALLDAWSLENTDSDIPAPTLDDKGNNEFKASSFFIEDGSYLKVRHVRLAYNFPQKWLKRVPISIYGEIQNLAMLTDYSGVDPELPYEGNINIPGIDNGAYPLPRTYLIGLNIKF